jgi:hypothetical protein
MARVAKLVSRWGIEFPAIPELDIKGVDVGDVTSADIARFPSAARWQVVAGAP